ncbi:MULTISPECIES: IctB family putative bicarbonate transporter [Spirulina sp. CCY15215]|uniref:IctB family putative bicarbonate transporter n=1 Tax=Spirulina sp. CCY15215 TaxID=2767591 RepID=UPI00194E27CB|nr:IctB family putative bicarbonate transporter [Spirulina major]
MLFDLPLSRWRSSSYLHRLVGLLGRWQDGSFLLQWGEAIAAILICIILVISPFASTSLIGLLLFACGAFWVLLTLADNLKIGMTPIHLWVSLYWGISAVSTAFSPVKKAALSGFIKFSLLLLLFLLAARVLRSPRLRNGIMTVFLHISLLVSGYGIRQEFKGVEQLATWNDPTSKLAQDTRVYSYLGNPNLLASYLIPAVALSLAAFFIWKRWLPKTLAAIMFLTNTTCLFYTDSRGGWIAMMALFFVFALLLRYWWAKYLPTFWRLWFLPLMMGAIAALVITAVVFVEPLRLRVMSIFAGREDSSNNYRINVWEAVFKMIKNYPLVGIGPGNDAFKEIYPLYAQSGYDNALGAYSVFLEHIVEIGYVGFISFLWFIIGTFGQGLQQLARLRENRNLQAFWLMAAIASTVGLLVHGLFDTVWYRPQINVLWWLGIAAIASFYDEKKLKNEA